MQNLGEKIGLIVRARGWHMKDFAAHIGYTAEHFSRLIKSKKFPDKALMRVAKGLDISPEELISIEILAGDPLPRFLAEPHSPYSIGKKQPTEGAEIAAERLQNEITRLQGEVDRLLGLLEQEQSISSRLTDTLKNLSGK